MLSSRLVERRWRNLAVAILVVAPLAVVGITASSVPANALPCDPTRQDCPPGGGTSRITYNLDVTTPANGKITSSDSGIDCGIGGTDDCEQSYTYTVTCDEFGECSTPDYDAVTLTPTPASGFDFASWSGACSGSGSCSVTMDDDRTVSASFADAQNPGVSLTSPTAGAIVQGSVNVSATASDNVGVGRVDFFLDGSLVGSDSNPPYSTSLDSNARADGRHTVAAQAVDTSGRQSNAVARSVIVDNLTPEILEGSLVPARAATVSDLTSSVKATFSEEMKPETLRNQDGTSSNFKLQVYNNKKKKWKTLPATVSLTVANNKTEATLDPLGNAGTLSAGKKYRAIVSTGAKDLADNPLSSNFSWTFKTQR